ncbi:unnamed protein product [Echinostoma caproni]|uniref:Kinesin-like protein n=1 Tax=Echinostoma caproni TaxID=27848 RepID=A0A183AHQ6_9TREM|nr:unnamed protein product [Echinostoma caproni]
MAKMVVKPDGLNGFELQSESDAIMDRHRLDYQQRLRLPRALTSHILREDAHRNVYVSGSIEVEVKTADDALQVFTTGLKRRRIGQTALNSESSRSHCIFTIRLVRTGYDEKYDEAIEDKNLLVISQLCLVDLAGSERAHRAGTQGDRLKEASSINSSLMNLRKCIEMLREIQRTGQWAQGLATPGGTTRVVPYRDKRLTHLFKNFFEGNGRVVILVCVHQSVEDYDETMHVLKFAESSQEVSTFRTPVIPAQSPAPNSQRRRYAEAYRDSGRSTGTTNTTTSLPTLIDEQISQYLAELVDFDVQVDRCLARLLNGVECNGQSTDSGTDATDDAVLWACDPEQDSAPENDRVVKDLNCRFLSNNMSPWKIDTEPLRALLTQRMDAHQRCYTAFEHELNAFREHLGDLVNTETGKVTEDANLVSILSRQWENRLAEQQQGEKQQPSARVNKTRAHDALGTLVSSASSSSVSQRRAAAFNPRHRRSRSVGGDTSRWLEHQETKAVPLGTVFTPNLKRRKSVTQVELKDTLKATNYLLHHQEADSDGNIETRLFKGSIIPTAGGGSAVIFDDVEELKQRSPSTKQRNSSTPKRKSSRLSAHQPTSGSSGEDSPPVTKGRKSTKRRRSPSTAARESASSTGTQSSQSSAQTNSSSNYEPFDIPPSTPRMPNHMNRASLLLEDSTRIGITSNGGMGSFGSATNRNARK